MHVLLAYRAAIMAVPSAHAAPEIQASKRISNITQICSFLSYKLYAQGHSAMLRYTIRLSVCLSLAQKKQEAQLSPRDRAMRRVS